MTVREDSVAGAVAPAHFLWSPSNWVANAPNQHYYYEITVARAGALRNVNLGLPAGTSTAGSLTSTSNIGGGATLVRRGNYLEYQLTDPYTVGAGWKLKITIIGLANPPTSKNLTFQSTAWSTGNTVLANAVSYPVSFALPPAFPPPVPYPVPDQPGSFAPYTIAAENRLPGQSSGVTKAITAAAEIEGFADRVSATCGQTVTLRVRIKDGSPTYRVEVFRMGYYSGVGSRLIATAGTFNATPQPNSYTIPQISLADGTVREMIATNWQPGASFRVQPDWTPGAYRIRLTNSNGFQVIIPLIIRDDASTSEYLLVNGFNTYQAYEAWGGTSLYINTLPPATSASVDRPAVVATFDRPYANGSDGRYGLQDYGFASWAEEMGLEVSYTTDTDLNSLGSTVRQHRTLVLLAHAEYWTDQGRALVADAVSSGMNLINLGTNQFYWRIQQRPGIVSALPDRSIYTYRSGATGLFRGNGQPEQAILGEQYTGSWGAFGDVVAANNWLFAGTGLPAGAKVPNLIYDEVDEVDRSYPIPPGTTVLAHSELSLFQNQKIRGHFHDMTFHVNAAEARIFSGGTLGWSPGLLGRFGIPAPIVRRMMQNVIDQVRNTGPAPTADALRADSLESLPPPESEPRVMSPMPGVIPQVGL
jgi:hypothetical protein